MCIGKKVLKKIISTIRSKKIEKVDIPMIYSEILSDRIAIIFGGSGGIGKGIAKCFINSGAKVIISGTNEEKLKKICAENSFEKCQYIVLDITETNKILEAIRGAEKKFQKKVSIFVNASGIHGNQSFGEVTEKTWDFVFNVNLKGMYFLCQNEVAYMEENHIKGNILNISSASALKPGWTPYEISKAGVKSLTLGVASESIEKGIIVNALAPGPVSTPMLQRNEGDNLYWENNPLGRLAIPTEIGNMAAFMVSDAGRMIVGDTVYMTGGSGTISLK